MSHNIEWLSISADISKVIAAFGSLVIAALAIWGNKIKPGPKLVIEDHNLTGDLTRIQPDNHEAIFYHLKLVNKRKWVAAENVKVICCGIETRVANNTFSPQQLSTYPQFVNTPGEMSQVTPTVKDEQIIDLGFIDSVSNKFSPRFYVMPFNFQGFVNGNQAVRLSIKIVANNFVSKKIYKYEIAYNGQWSNNLLTMKDNLTIRRIIE